MLGHGYLGKLVLEETRVLLKALLYSALDTAQIRGYGRCNFDVVMQRL